MKSATAFTPKTRNVLGTLCIFLVLVLMAGAWTLPFVFESMTMYYKSGLDKVLLRSGKVVGITAAMLLFFQVLLVSRVKILDKIFALNRLYNFHRINGITIAVLALLHPLLILGSEGFTLFPFEKRYWPEFLGIGLFVVILGIIATSNWRMVFGLAYNVWLRLHRPITMVAIASVSIHILFVSETFESGLPRALVLVAAGLNTLLIVRLWYCRLFPGKRKLIVSGVTPAGKHAQVLELRPVDGPIFPYLPGQFAFITPASANLPREEHPFTLASSPSRPDTLQFVIRSLGDWTSKIDRLQTEDTVFIDGPYGLFSHKAFAEDDPLILIAGGIGITPMLSMLRFMVDANDQRSVLLIWSNKTQASIVLPEEFEDLQRRLQNIKIIHVITRSESGIDAEGRLDRAKLDRLLEGYSRKSRIFICGPPGMMQAVSRALQSAGFMAARIHIEKFQF
jgi:predicted ferric reductase